MVDYHSEYKFYPVDSEGLIIKRATAPKMGTQITIRTQIAVAVEDRCRFFIVNREIIDRMIQDKIKMILKIPNRNEIVKFSIVLSILFDET